MNQILLKDAIGKWQADLLSGQAPIRYCCGALDNLKIGPNKIIMIGAPPGVGKTALVMQATFDALQNNPDLKAVVCNVEMTPAELLERELARVTKISLDEIQSRELDSYQERIKEGIQTIKKVENRLAFVQPPFCLTDTFRAAEDLGADLIILDYIQRIPAKPDKSQDIRLQLNEAMALIRLAANECGKAFIVISSVSRGDNYKSLGLGSFRESSELEFGVDGAYLLVKDKDATDGFMKLKHVKTRFSKLQDIHLRFIGEYQRFDLAGGKHE